MIELMTAFDYEQQLVETQPFISTPDRVPNPVRGET